MPYTLDRGKNNCREYVLPPCLWCFVQLAIIMLAVWHSLVRVARPGGGHYERSACHSSFVQSTFLLKQRRRN